MGEAFPSPYKMVVLRWEDGVELWKIFDCVENPIPPSEGSLFQLLSYSYVSLDRLDKKVAEINSSKNLEGTGCNYYLAGMDTGGFTGPQHNGWYVLKLANSEAVFMAVANAGTNKNGLYTPDYSGTSTPK
ncbi:hypothetical protein ABW20_dc0108976 [Dactylellina cionopaga]|nr:hypothetical protein ABW20_dc0108976 [Dactylellina cionopaga]